MSTSTQSIGFTGIGIDGRELEDRLTIQDRFALQVPLLLRNDVWTIFRSFFPERERMVAVRELIRRYHETRINYRKQNPLARTVPSPFPFTASFTVEGIEEKQHGLILVLEASLEVGDAGQLELRISPRPFEVDNDWVLLNL